MTRFLLPILAGLLVMIAARTSGAADEVLFEDNFDKGLAAKWSAVGLKKEDYRIKAGALEMRVRPRARNEAIPLLRVTLPFNTNERVSASVEVTPVDPFTEPGESAGLYLLDGDSPEFEVEKTIAGGYFVFSPPELVFIGKEGDEESGDQRDYAVKFWPANADFGPLRIITGGHHATFQVGPSKAGKYMNLFESALNREAPKRGFALGAYGGPTDKEHWVRFDNFRVVRSK